MTQEFGIGSTLIIDGKAWTVATLDAPKCSATRAEGEKDVRISLDARDVIDMGGGLFGLPRRIEPPKVPDGAIIAGVGVADLTAG